MENTEIENTENNNTENLICGKIYKICSYKIPDIYIGSTTSKHLSMRFSVHRQRARNMRKKSKLYRTMRSVGIDSFIIVLITEVKCKNNEELHKIEEEYRIKEKATLNQRCCGTGINLKGKEYSKQYYQENKEKIKTTANQHYYDNKEKINKHRNEKVKCEYCGAFYIRSYKSAHERSLKHHRALENIARESEFN
jgi:hypothetical protein